MHDHGERPEAASGGGPAAGIEPSAAPGPAAGPAAEPAREAEQAVAGAIRTGRLVIRTGAEQPWDPEDLAVAEGRDPTPANVERARQELERLGPAAIERTVP